MIKDFLKKHKQLILYVFFGALTTLVNYVVYFLCKGFGINYQLSTVIAWVAAVLFAFITNKTFVFESKSNHIKTVGREIFLFFGGRLFSLGLELLIMKIGMDFLHAEKFTLIAFGKNLPAGEFLTKTVAQTVVLITNFLISKFLIFKKKKVGENIENTCD